MTSYYVNRNQADREAFVIHETETFDLVYYFMPNGPMYINKVFHNKQDKYGKDYATVTQKSLTQYVAKHPELKPEVVSMLHRHNEILEELIDGLSKFDYRRRKLEKLIEGNVAQIKAFELP